MAYKKLDDCLREEYKNEEGLRQYEEAKKLWLVDSITDKPFERVEPPAYCWPCKAQKLRIDPEALLERAAEGHHEDAHDQIEAADELCSFIEAWNEKQTCTSWYPDYSRVIVLDEARFKALLDGDAMT